MTSSRTISVVSASHSTSARQCPTSDSRSPVSTSPTSSCRLGAFVAGSLCGTAGSFAAQLTVPGERTVPCAAVTQVTVLPTHRRRGLLGAMMRPQLQDAIDRGEPTAMLVAAEWPIYGRYGYGMAVEAAATDRRRRRGRVPRPGLEGSIELVDAGRAGRARARTFDRHRITSPGAIDRRRTGGRSTPAWWRARAWNRRRTGSGSSTVTRPGSWTVRGVRPERQVGAQPTPRDAECRGVHRRHARRMARSVALSVRGRLGDRGAG